MKKQLTMRKNCKRGACLNRLIIEQWKEVTSRKYRQKLKTAAHVSLLTVENSHNSSSKNMMEVKGR